MKVFLSLSALALCTLVSEGLISEYKFIFIPETTSDLQGSKQVRVIILWYASEAF